MPRTVNRPRRRRRHEISVQVVQDIQTLHAEQTQLTQHAGDSDNESKSPPASIFALRPPVSSSAAATQHKQGTLQCWKASSSGYSTTCELFSSDDTSFICPIMHEPMCSAVVDDIPSTWPLSDSTCANTVQLACSHSFFAPALALHFLATDMRCPVCRAGCSEHMHIDSVPSSVRPMYVAKLHGLQKRSIEYEVSSIEPGHISNVLSELELEMRIFAVSAEDPSVSSHTTTARTRVIFDAQHVQHIQGSMLAVAIANSSVQDDANVPDDTNLPMTTNFSLHRSFQRLIRGMLGRQYVQQTGAVVCFALTHPLLPLSFRSNQLSVAEAWNAHFTPGAAAGACIPLFCVNVGGTEPLAFLRSTYCTTTHTTSITIDVNIHMIINISSYVSDVLESIRESIRQHMIIDNPATHTLNEESFPTLGSSQSLEQPVA
jgi:hypothetical protein